jgi:hypothetical protein
VKREYRVSWQREGSERVRALRQTLPAAQRLAERQAKAAEEMDWLEPRLRPLVGPPEIESREVGPWQRENWPMQVIVS